MINNRILREIKLVWKGEMLIKDETEIANRVDDVE